MLNLYNDYRVLIRKKIAALKKNGTNKAAMLKQVQAEKARLTDIPPISRVLSTIHVAQHHGRQSKCEECIKLAEEAAKTITFGKLLGVLERLVQEEANRNLSSSPSPTDIERWALKQAVLDYYRGLNLAPDTKIMEDLASYKTLPQFAPNTQAIYELWVRRLTDLTTRTDQNRFDPKRLDRLQERGIVQGGALEKQLQRYREEFMKRVVYE